jgi:hypothetical protein|nr:hypothetical protein [Neorhizobium tomejilense]
MTLERRILDLTAKPLDHANAERLSALLDAASEQAADIIPTATRQELERAAQDAAAAMNFLRRNHDIDRRSPEFLAGRLAALTDVYGYSAAVTADADIAAPLANPVYAAVFDAISRGFTSDDEIASEAGEEPAAIRPIIAELCCASLIVEFRHGRGRHYGLSSVGRLVELPQVSDPAPATTPTPF